MYLFIFLSCYSTLFGYTLRNNYVYKDTVIKSSDVLPECPARFELLKIPDGKTSYRVDTHVIIKSFELFKCHIDPVSFPYVTFRRSSAIDTTILENQLINYFQEHYPSINIDHIDIQPHGYLDTLPDGIKAIFDQNTHTRSKGTFYIVDSNSIRRYFDFTLYATLPVLLTKKKVARHELLSDITTKISQQPFSTFKSIPISSLPPSNYRFANAMRDNSPILSRNIEPVPIVSKGNNVIVVIKNGAVEMEFSASAIQEGSLYDIITIQKNDGKRVKAKIIGENRVELQ